ncbi:hypothetical protein HDU93_008800 [Gonapodya sp. JEL0774]|nr:hypothetical protein HDU93_008800 [Gonapodya sp. JEL0774]
MVPRPSPLNLASSPSSFTETIFSPRSARSGSFQSSSGTLCSDENRDCEVDIVDIFGGMDDLAADFNSTSKVLGKTTMRGFQKPTMKLLDLPWEIKLRIFGLLDQIELVRISIVCRSFHRLSADGHLWASIDLSHHYRLVPAQQILRLCVNAGGFLKVANFRGCGHVPASTFSLLPGPCPHISQLDLQGCLSLSSAGLSQMLSHLKELKSLNLTGLNCVTDRSLQVLGRAAGKELEKCEIGFCRGVTAGGIRHIVRYCTNLSTLHVPHLPLEDTSLENIGRKLPHLISFDARGCAEITPKGVISMLEIMGKIGHPELADRDDADTLPTSLVCLRLSQIPALDDTALLAIGSHCPLLQTLELAGAHLVTDLGVASIAKKCNRLRHLDLEECSLVTDTGLAFIATHLVHLERLSIGFLDRVTDDGVVGVKERLWLPKRGSSLTYGISR